MDEGKFIACRIKELRKNAGLDVDTVGKGVGRSGKTVSAWETGRNMPSPEMLISICRFFDVGISYFYPPDVADNRYPALAKPVQTLADLCSELDPQQIDILISTARQFAVANKSDGAADTGDVERAGVALN